MAARRARVTASYGIDRQQHLLLSLCRFVKISRLVQMLEEKTHAPTAWWCHTRSLLMI